MRFEYAKNISNAKYGVNIYEFDAKKSSMEQINKIKELIYNNNIVVLKNQNLTPKEYVNLGKMFGKVETYYESMYHHPEEKEIFVSSNINKNGKNTGVPKTGNFWHADYAFMENPFSFTLIYPRIVPKKKRGTYFIDMAEAYRNLPPELKDNVRNLTSCHSVRRYFKIRPSDVYRPICDLLEEVENKTPPAFHPATFTHPVTGETILYISEATTYELRNAQDHPVNRDLLQRLLEATGQLDTTYQNPLIHMQTFSETDLIIWDNRRMIHRSLHTNTPEPAESHRITVYDEYPFC